MHALARLRACGDGLSFLGIGEAIEQGGSDLRAPGVVHAREENSDHDACSATCSRFSSFTLIVVWVRACKAALTTAAITGLSIGASR